jgi:type IV pilus assembly protein PilC
MPEFILRVGTPEGDVVERSVRAASLRAAREELQRQGMHVFEAKRGTMTARDFIPRGGKVISTERFLLFNQELLALVRAGLPIVQSFDIMLERQKNPRFREVLAEVREKIMSGIALSDAFASYGPMFPAIYSTSIRAGERSGDLEGVLKRFLRYQKMIVALRKRVVGALIYPVILMFLSGAMIFIMLTAVIPKFAEFFSGFGAELPWFTTLMINLATTLRKNVFLVLGGTAAVVYVARRWASSCTGSRSCSSPSRSAPSSRAARRWSRRSRSPRSRSPTSSCRRRSPESCRTCAKESRCGARWTAPAS